MKEESCIQKQMSILDDCWEAEIWQVAEVNLWQGDLGGVARPVPYRVLRDHGAAFTVERLASVCVSGKSGVV